jgi:hypothetical protein
MVAVAFAAIMCPDVPCFSAPKTGLPMVAGSLRCSLRGTGRIQASVSFKNSEKNESTEFLPDHGDGRRFFHCQNILFCIAHVCNGVSRLTATFIHILVDATLKHEPT